MFRASWDRRSAAVYPFSILHSMYIVSVIAYSFSIFAIHIGCNALIAYSYSPYKLVVTSMSRLAVVIVLRHVMLSLHQ